MTWLPEHVTRPRDQVQFVDSIVIVDIEGSRGSGHVVVVTWCECLLSRGAYKSGHEVQTARDHVTVSAS